MSNDKRSLIVGGTSSIAKDIVDLLKKQNYSLDLTCSSFKKLKQKDIHYENVNWIELNFNDNESFGNFIDEIKNNIYDIVVILSMSSPGDFLENSENDLRSFYGNYLVNNMLLGKNLLKNLTANGKIIYVSSIASSKPVPEVNYSTIKGALQSFYTSLSTKVKMQQTIFSIVPGLIYDTPSFYNCSPLVYNNNVNILTKKEDIANLIVSSNFLHNGKIIRLGEDE